MTNLERIKNMTVEEMAQFNVAYDDRHDLYFTSDGTKFPTQFEDIFYNLYRGATYEKAIKHEIDWLNSECEE